jgi:spore coat protein A
VTGFDRRTFLALVAAAGAGAGIGIPLVSGVGGSSSTGTALRSQLPLPEPFTLPLTVPPVLAPVRADATGDHYELVQRAATVEILPGVPTPIWGYNGVFPGPTIVSRSGRTTVVHHRNTLPVPVVAHLHGGHTPGPSDGYPTDLILPVGSSPQQPTMPGMPGMNDPRAVVTVCERTYTYPLRQPAATLWYHDHRMGFTGASVWRGLAGFHLVHDDEEDALPLPRGTRDLPLMIADRAFSWDGSLRYPSVDPSLQDTPGVTGAYSAGVLGTSSWSTAGRGHWPRCRRCGTGCGCSTRPTPAATGSRWIRRHPAVVGWCRSVPTAACWAAPVATTPSSWHRRNAST